MTRECKSWTVVACGCWWLLAMAAAGVIVLDRLSRSLGIKTLHMYRTTCASATGLYGSWYKLQLLWAGKKRALREVG